MVLKELKSQDLLRTITLIVRGSSFSSNDALASTLGQHEYGEVEMESTSFIEFQINIFSHQTTGFNNCHDHCNLSPALSSFPAQTR